MTGEARTRGFVRDPKAPMARKKKAAAARKRAIKKLKRMAR